MAVWGKDWLKALLICIPLLLPACSLKSCSHGKSETRHTLSFNLDAVSQLVLLQDSTQIADSTVNSNVLGIDANGAAKAVIKSDLSVSAQYAVLSPDKKKLYLEISIEEGGLENINQDACSLYRIDIASNQTDCVLRNFTSSLWDEKNLTWSVIKNPLKPIQFDAQQNVYVLAQKFLSYCQDDCQVGELVTDYQRVENKRGDIFYVQNSHQIFRIGTDGSTETVTLSDADIEAFVVMGSRKLALLSQVDNVNHLHIWHEGQILEQQPFEQVNSLIVDDHGSLLLNNNFLLRVSENNDVFVSSAANSLRENTNLQLGASSEILDAKGTLLYRTLPFDLRPIAQLNSAESDIAYSEDYVFENDQGNLVLHNENARSRSDAREKLAGLDNYLFVGAPAVADNGLYSVVKQADSDSSYLLMLDLDSISTGKVDESAYQKLMFSSKASSGIKSLINLRDTKESTDFYLKKTYGFSENRASFSVNFSKAYDPLIQENIRLENDAIQAIGYFSFYMGRYFHLIVDTDGVENNNYTNSQIQNHIPLQSGNKYTLTIDTDLKSQDGDVLETTVDGVAYPNKKSVKIAPATDVYHSTLDEFNRQYPAINRKLAAGGVIAKSACVLDDCSGLYYYNLGVPKMENVRIEFSSSNAFVQLALWDSYRYSQSYDHTFAPAYAFWADTHSMNVKNIDSVSVQPMSDLESPELADKNFWRRYRLDFFGSTVQVSWSVDGEDFTLVDSLTVNDTVSHSVNNNEYFWLMEFDGALDNLQVSTLDSDGNVIYFEGDLLQESFNVQVDFSEDSSNANSIGFEENIINNLTLSSGSGSPDQTYGERGIAPIENSPDVSGNRLQRLLVDNEGNSYIVGNVFYGTEGHFALWKYNSDGQRDLSFGTNGLFIYQDEISEANDIVIGPDNKLYVAGFVTDMNADTDVAIWRINTDGTLDTSFNNTGRVSYSTDNKEVAFNIIVDGNSIYLRGIENGELAVWKYDMQGNLDAGFNGSGLLTIAGIIDGYKAYNMVLDNAGNLLLIGYQENAPDSIDAILYRVSNSGAIDKTINLNELISMNAIVPFNTLKLDNNGKLLLFGYYQATANTDLLLVRLNGDFSIDNGFADNGIMAYDSLDKDVSYSIVLDSIDRIYLLSSTGNATLSLLRLNDNGSLDNSFQKLGWVNKSAYAVDVAIDYSGEIEKAIIAGTSIIADNHKGQSALWRIVLD